MPLNRKLRLEQFIAHRMGLQGRSSRVMSCVATISVSVSLAVMIIAISVVSGFRSDIRQKITGLGAHVQITATGDARPVYYGDDQQSDPASDPSTDYDSALVAQVSTLPEVTHIQRHATKAGILRSDSAALQGIILKGVGSDYDPSFLERHLVRGHIPRYTDTVRNREAVISQSIARAMTLDTGSRFELLFVGHSTPRRERLRVSGIYSTGMEEFDRSLIIGDISVVQRLNNQGSKAISGYEIALDDKADTDLTSEAISELLIESSDAHDQNLDVATIYDTYPQLFDWLDMLDLNTTIVIVIMMIVAVINMICGVLIIVLEQTRTIGVLKALGMGNGGLQTIFVLRSSSITLRGMAWGNITGLALCLIQSLFGVLTLDPQSYMMATVPIHIDWLQVALLNVGTFVVITSMMTIPTLIISRITPDRSIRFQ